MADAISQKDAEIQRLSTLVGQTDLRIKQAVRAREEELSVLVMQREDEVRVVLVGRAAADLEDLGVVSRVDAVAGRVSGVAG